MCLRMKIGVKNVVSCLPILTTILSIQCLALEPNRQFQVGVVGDSAVTGAVTDPSLDFTITSLAGKVGAFLIQPEFVDNIPNLNQYKNPLEFNITRVEPAARIFFSNGEINTDTSIVDLNLSAKGSMKMDIEEFSFPYLISKKLGYSGRQVLFAAQDGSQIDSMYKQFKRLEYANAGHLPPVVFVSYNANDICSLDTYKEDISQLKATYKARLVTQFKQIFNRIKPNPKGTTIIWFAPIDVMQVVTNQLLLMTEVPFHTQKSVTCYALRATRNMDLPNLTMSENIAKSFHRANQTECDAIMSLSPYDIKRIDFMKKLFQSLKEAQSETLVDLQKNPKYKVHWFDESSQVQFIKDDVANDCFHPSIQGQEHLARQIYPFVANLFYPKSTKKASNQYTMGSSSQK